MLVNKSQNNLSSKETTIFFKSCQLVADVVYLEWELFHSQIPFISNQD